MIWGLLKFLATGPLDRALDSVDRRVAASTERNKLRADLVQTHLRTRGDYMRAGGFWLMVMFAAPLALWHGLVVYDSALGCADCLWANDWTVAALPSPLDDWAGGIIVSIFGVVGLDRIGRK